MGLRMTEHARRRANQRGVRQEILEILLLAGDRVRDARGDCVACSFTRKGLRRLATNGIRADELERLDGLVAIVSSGAQVVTVFRDEMRGRGGRPRHAPAPRPRHWQRQVERWLEEGDMTVAV